MNYLVRYFFVSMIGAVAFSVAIAVGGLAVARATLPNSACVITEAQLEALELEKMKYRDVKQVLGCDGVLTYRQDYGGELVLEDYTWRGDAWPYAKFEGHFINGVLHGTQKTWVKLALN